jgi:hypothetical protein
MQEKAGPSLRSPETHFQPLENCHSESATADEEPAFFRRAHKNSGAFAPLSRNFERGGG